jgi:hypothetical protein
MKRLLGLLNFNCKWIFQTDCSRNPQQETSQKSVKVGGELFHAGRRTDGDMTKSIFAFRRWLQTHLKSGPLCSLYILLQLNNN